MPLRIPTVKQLFASPGTSWCAHLPRTVIWSRTITGKNRLPCMYLRILTLLSNGPSLYQRRESIMVTVENHRRRLPESLVNQIQMFLPPEGSFDDGCLQRYLENLKNYEQEDANSGMTLANRLRIAFQDMTPDTICGKFPKAELPLKTTAALRG
jgi:hypothetical protein